MKLIDVLTAPWMIAPAKLREIRAIYETHMRGDKIDLRAISSQSQKVKGYEVQNGIAIISIEGVLTKNLDFWSRFFGGTSMREVGDAFELALEDRMVSAIVLSVDSPGGTVDGTQELVGRIAAGRGKKPIIAWADGIIASAAYWISSATDKIFISGDTTESGSIGVVATHIDFSEQDRQYGEKWTEITAGKYKRIASAHAPLSYEGRAYIQTQVDHLYSVFVESVASLRGRSIEQVLESADGKIYIGRQAVDAGLVDGVSTLSGVIAQITEEMKMDKTELKTKHPELYQSLIDEGRSAGIQEGIERGKKEGRDAAVAEGQAMERERIKSIHEIESPGNEKIITEAMFDGKSTAGEVALKVIAADKKRREEMAKNIEEGAVKPVPTVDATAEEGKVETFESEVGRHIATGKTRGEAMAMVAREKPKLHEDYLRRINEKK